MTAGGGVTPVRREAQPPGHVDVGHLETVQLLARLQVTEPDRAVLVPRQEPASVLADGHVLVVVGTQVELAYLLPGRRVPDDEGFLFGPDVAGQLFFSGEH